MGSISRAFYNKYLYGSYNAIRRASAFTISGSVLLQQVNIHTESDANRSQVSQQSAETGEGFDGDEDDKEVYNAKIIHSSLLQRLKVPRNQCVVPVLQSWIEAGNELGVYEMKIACTRLKCQKKYKQALEVADWILKEKPFELVESHYAWWLYYRGKVHGYEEAEKAFSLIPPEFQKEVIYCRLFDIYLEYDKVDEAEGIIKRMKDQQVSVPVYICNNLITFYDKNFSQVKIPALLEVMEKEKISFNKETYNVLLACNLRDSDGKGMESMFGLMKADMSVKPDFVSYTTVASAYLFAGQNEKALAALQEAERDLEEHPATVKKLMKLMSLYGSLKKGEDVDRLYQRLKCIPGQRSVLSYLCAIEAYGEAGLVDSSEEIMKEMELQRGFNNRVQYNALIGMYCKNGMVKKAEKVLKKLHNPNIITYTYLLLGYLKTEQLEKVASIFKNVETDIRAIAFDCQFFLSRRLVLTMHDIVGFLGEKGDEKHAKALLHALEASNFQNFPRSYHFIRKAYEQSFGCSWLCQEER